MVNSVVTKFGVFNVEKCDNGSLVSYGNNAVQLPVNWWDKDAIIEKIEKNPKISEMLLQTKVEKPSFEISSVEDAASYLEKIDGYLRENISDGKERGFIVSRTSQVVKKLKELHNK